MKKRLLITTLVLSLALVACGNSESTSATTSAEVNESTSVATEDTQSSIDVPFECDVIIDDETGVDYYTLIGTMNDMDQLNAYTTTALELGSSYPNSVFNFIYEDKQVTLMFDNGSLSISSTDEDGIGIVELPAWYEKKTDADAENVIKYALSKAERGNWITVD